MRSTMTRSSTWWAKSCPRPRSSACCATTTPGKLGDADLEERLLTRRERGPLPGHLPERAGGAGDQEAQPGDADRTARTGAGAPRRAGDHRALHRDAAPHVPLGAEAVPSLPHTFEPGRHAVGASALREASRTGSCTALPNRYPRFSTDRETAEKNNLEWVTPGHPLFEAMRRHTLDKARDYACRRRLLLFARRRPARANRLSIAPESSTASGDVIHERLFAVEIREDGAIEPARPRSCWGT